MRYGSVLLLGLLLVGCVAPPATARQTKGRDYRGVCWLLFYDDGIAAELKLTAGQMEKARQVVNDATDRFKDKLAEARAASKAGDEKKWNDAVTEAARETDKALAAVLAADQMKRLRQIHLQAYALSTMLRSEEGKVLALTDEQRARITQISRKGGKVSDEQYRALTDEAVSLLTPEQKRVWKDLVGETYIRKPRRP